MKNALFLLAFAVLLSQCNSLEFEQPLPDGGKEVNALPDNLVGTYVDAEDSNAILKKYQRLEFNSKDQTWKMYFQHFLLVSALDTSSEAFVRNDSLFSIEPDTISPKFAFTVKRLGDRYVAPAKLRYQIEPSRGKFVLYDEDTDKPSDHILVLRKKGEVYFFNIKEKDAKYWQTTTLQLTADGLQLQYLSAPNGSKADLPFVTRAVVSTSAEGNSDTTYVAKPTDRQLDKYLRNADLVNRENLIRAPDKN